MDGLGNPVYFHLSAGNVHDSTLAVEVLSHVKLSGSNVLGDKAYGTVAIREYITSRVVNIHHTTKIKYRKSMGMRLSCL